MMKTAVYMAQANDGDTHEILNVSIVVMLLNIFQQVKVYAPQSCCESIEQGLIKYGCDTKKIRFVHSKIFFRKPLPFWFSCGLQEVFAMLLNRKAVFFFSTLNFLMFPIFNIIANFFSLRLFTLCHNDMEHLVKPKRGRINVHWMLINYIFKKMNFSNENFCIVLGDSVKRNLQPYVNEMTYSKNLIAITHPYCALSKQNACSVNEEAPLKVAIVGTIKSQDEKNIAIIDRIVAKYPKVKFYAVSTSAVDLQRFSHIINLNKNNRHLPRDEYDRIISEMDCLFFPYPKDSYFVSASGAVFEAIVRGKLILAERNMFFQDLFESFGCMGVLFNDLEEFDSILASNSIQQNKKDFIENALQASRRIDPAVYGLTFKKIVFEALQVTYDR